MAARCSARERAGHGDAEGRVSLARGVATVGGYTLASRVLGFLRDMLVAAYLGAGPVADAFLVAFKLPNFFRRLFAEGAFNAAFVPIFAGMVARSSPRTRWRCCSPCCWRSPSSRRRRCRISSR
jgi:hypothetical protein